MKIIINIIAQHPPPFSVFVSSVLPAFPFWQMLVTFYPDYQQPVTKSVCSRKQKREKQITTIINAASLYKYMFK